MGAGLRRATWFGKWGDAPAIALLLALYGCGTEAPQADPMVSGPAMGIVEVNPNDIPLGEGGKPPQGHAGSSALAGSGGSIGTAGNIGSGGTAGAPTVKESDLGKACETSTDCGDRLSCHLDSVDYTSHLQCTISCNSDAPCKDVDPAGYCIGANVCVKGCLSDADCGPKTRCGDLGWCERKGPGSGIPYCGGFPTPCGLLTGINCIGALGCSDDSDCSGVSQSCYSQFDVYSCTSQDGCYWSSLNKNCSGSARFCSAYSSDLSCESQEGCSWHSSCTGTPHECDELPVDLCSSQPGCTVLTD